MSDMSSIQRLQELEAGRIFGDLSDEEWREWETLSRDHSDILDGSLEWAAAQLEAGLAGESGEMAMPSGLTDKVKAGVGVSAYVRPPTEEQIGKSCASEKMRAYNKQRKVDDPDGYKKEKARAGD